MPCFDREEETADVWRRIDGEQNLLMLAPRRIGKTVLLNRLHEMATQQRYRAIILDVEGFHDEKDLFRQCCAAIQEELSTGGSVMAAFTHRLKQIVRGSATEGSDWRQILVQTDWQVFADQLFSHLDDHGEEPPWLILVDELPVFLKSLHSAEGRASIEEFLYWLRGVRQKYRNVRWLYAGSIGLDTVAREQNVEGALNDLHPVTIEPFTEEIAAAFLVNIAERRNCTFEEQAVRHTIDRLGWLSPYYLERIAEDACLNSDRGTAIGIRAVDLAMDQLLDLSKRIYWSSWREHLDRNFSEPTRGHLYAILEFVAQSKVGATWNLILTSMNVDSDKLTQIELRNLIDTLVSDGYLIRGNDQLYKFRMNLLREWWLRYVVL